MHVRGRVRVLTLTCPAGRGGAHYSSMSGPARPLAGCGVRRKVASSKELRSEDPTNLAFRVASARAGGGE